MMTQIFNVLDQDCLLKGKFLLEASAGTGKTFSIENIVLRKILEGDLLESILAVTFTKAAVRDLKERIHKNLEKTLAYFNDPDPARDDFTKMYTASTESLKEAKKRLKAALSTFEQAQIFTIHGFCQRILREFFFEAQLGGMHEDATLSQQELLRILRDFFRLELDSHFYCPEQIDAVLRKNGGMEGLEKRLIREMGKGPWKETASYTALERRFETVLSAIKGRYDLEKVKADLLLQNGARTASTKAFFIEQVEQFCESLMRSDVSKLFRSLIAEGVAFLDKLKSKKDHSLHYPDFLSVLQSEFIPILEEARSEMFILSRLLAHCQKFMASYLKKEEKVRFDDLLENACQAVLNPSFKEHVQKQYRVAVIDEFQDTDPLQWTIFEKLFGQLSGWQGDLFLVGDPKQSIYGFRRADIYTYLKAGISLNPSHHLSLNTNFRSQPSLIKALNFIFSQSQGLFLLPRTGSEIGYQQVAPSSKVNEFTFRDAWGPLHFFYAVQQPKQTFKEIEETLFLPFITQEILRLKQKDGLNYGKMAVLVSRHQQADRVQAFLKQWGIPCVLQRVKSLYETRAFTAMQELLKAVMNPRQESYLKVVLGGPLFGWDHRRLFSLTDLDLYASVLGQFKEYHELLVTRGFADFYLRFIETPQDHAESLIEKILSREDGKAFYENFSQIAEELIEYQALYHASPEMLLHYLRQFETLHLNEDDKIKCRRDPNEEGVQILTIHSSKGLEFEVVFALGLSDRTPKPDPIYYGEAGFCPVLEPEESQEHRLYCEELDEEKMRQLYVAMTRAKHRLYVPVIFPAEAKDLSPAVGSPMELFMAKWESVQGTADDFYTRAKHLQPTHLLQLLAKSEASLMTGQELTNGGFLLEPAQKKPPVPLQAPKELKISSKFLHMYSYSILAKRLPQHIAQRPSDLRPPHDWKEDQKNRHTLPSGSATGNLIHYLYQKIPFEIAQDRESILKWLEEALPTPFLDWKEAYCEILESTLNTTLFEGFKLSDLSSARFYREMEFVYPLEDAAMMKAWKVHEGYFKGVIDFIFEHAGKYYILDWKSNWLGPSEAYYENHALEAVMHQHHYFVQARIYRQALDNYLSMLLNQPFESIFGGTFYLFVRGCQKQSSTGIYFISNEGRADDFRI